MKPAKCPFYPDSCTVEFHPNMQHVWKGSLLYAAMRNDPKGLIKATEELLRATEAMKAPAITNVKITNKKADRARAWNKANRETYNARQKKIMSAKRGKRGS